MRNRREKDKEGKNSSNPRLWTAGHQMFSRAHTQFSMAHHLLQNSLQWVITILKPTRFFTDWIDSVFYRIDSVFCTTKSVFSLNQLGFFSEPTQLLYRTDSIIFQNRLSSFTEPTRTFFSPNRLGFWVSFFFSLLNKVRGHSRLCSSLQKDT